MIRETWAEARKNQNKILNKKELSEGIYNVSIESVRFFESSKELPECLSLRFEVASGSFRNHKFTSNQYFTSRKGILVWRSDIRKIIPNAYDMEFDSVLESFQAISEKKINLKIGVSYNGNGNGKKFLNVKYLQDEENTTRESAEVDEANNEDPF